MRAMIFIENLRLALTSLRANKSRALLTMLGIIIGIASVIAIMTVGNSLTLSVSSSMQSMGANNVTVSLKQREAQSEQKENGIVFGSKENTREITENDYFTNDMIYEMTKQFPDFIEAISASEVVGEGMVRQENENHSVNINGVSRGYFAANECTMMAGSIFSQREAAEGQNVILVADTLVEKIYGEDVHEGLGKELEVKVNNQTMKYTIIGVYEYEESAFGASDTTTAYIPLTMAQNINHTKNYATFQVVTKVGVDSDQFAGQIEDFMNGFYRSNSYFEVNAYSMSSMVSIFSDMMDTTITAIAVIAGIALLVGGIGVMNIMLVSITERTREIGTRKALGASNTYIRVQFIVEAMIICLIGGAIGIVLGIGMGSFGASLLGYSASPSVSSIVGSLVFSLMIGLFFGYYPANKAAKMNPIDALRYE